MIVRVADIPPEGLNLTVELDNDALTQRTDVIVEGAGDSISSGPTHIFSGTTYAEVKLELERSTVVVSGEVSAKYKTICGRCAEDANKDLNFNLNIILKPHSERDSAETDQEDLGLGFYENKEINLAAILEEHLVLEIPYSDLCKEDCKGLCPDCGNNLNTGNCICTIEDFADPCLEVLKGIKIH